MPFTLKQQRFIDYYDGNATQAAIKAGYSKKTAFAIGIENLRKPIILEAIQKRTQKSANKVISSREDLQEFWTKVYNNDEASLSDRLRASELLGKSKAVFIEKHEHSGEITFTKLVQMVSQYDEPTD